MAEALFRKAAASRQALASIAVASAGTIALDGNRATPDAIRAAREEFDLDLTAHRARDVSRLDADLVLTMDARVTREVRRLGLRGQIILLGEFAGGGEIVEDPYGCAPEVYRACARQLQRLVESAADRLEREAPPPP